MSAYTPHEGSLAGRVMAFLRKNPEEMLSASDILIKFDEPDQRAQSVYQRLRSAMDAGLITRRAVDGIQMYLLPGNVPIPNVLPKEDLVLVGTGKVLQNGQIDVTWFSSLHVQPGGVGLVLVKCDGVQASERRA